MTDTTAGGTTPSRSATIGVLAMQGAFREHARALVSVGATAVEVRTSADLEGLDGIVIPGGESTTMRKLLARSDLGRVLRARIEQGLPALGTCAGLVVLAHADADGAPDTMGLLDVDVVRNGFGRQPDSFEGDVAITPSGLPDHGRAMHGVFIRAPRVTRVGDDVQVIGRLAAGTELDGEPVIVRQGRIVGATFHPELTDDGRLHEWFVEMCNEERQMAGHSKWANIKHRKGRQDAKRGVLFSKLARAITVAAKAGLPDPDANASLAQAIQAAKDVSMPKDNIDRAIAKAAQTADADTFDAVSYEGYGPAGVAVIAECLTDNRNRTAAEVRHAFSKHGGSLGTAGCVSWSFDRLGELELAEGADEDEALMAAADAGADDVSSDGGTVIVTCEASSLMAVRKALEAAGFTVERSELVLRPQNTIEVDEAQARTTMKLIDALEDLDDVQKVFANADISDEVFEALNA